MCHCCKLCWEEIIWTCFEEKFCYDESIATYNPEEDDDFEAKHKHVNITNQVPVSNKHLIAANAICEQPTSNIGNYTNLSGKIHEEDYQRETNTNVPVLGPEILAVFANSQIFRDNQSAKLKRINTKSYTECSTANHVYEIDQSRLIKYLEESINFCNEDVVKTKLRYQEPLHNVRNITLNKKVLLNVAPCSPFSQKSTGNINTSNLDNEVILSPRTMGIDKFYYDLLQKDNENISTPNQVLRSAQSAPYIFQNANPTEIDFFAITGSGNSISMTPEVPAISYTNLPKNYDNTPTIEKYRTFQSLHSIQTANNAKANEDDYSMPRYFRQLNLVPRSDLMLSSDRLNCTDTSFQENNLLTGKEKTNRLKMIRNTLPPLLLQTEFFENIAE